MEFVNIHDAKTHLSKYISMAQKNHEAIIICKNGVPVAQLSEYKAQPKRKIGVLKNKIKISDDFDVELPDEIMGEYK
jgi:prevent-host-death family protein